VLNIDRHSFRSLNLHPQEDIPTFIYYFIIFAYFFNFFRPV
jgi:hypothetical protein